MSSTASLTTMITIDSADRNQITYPNPAQYVYKLPQSIRNADTIEIMMFQMTIGESSVNNGNNTFILRQGNVNKTVTIPEGQYDFATAGSSNDFSSAVATSLNTVSSNFGVLPYYNNAYNNIGGSLAIYNSNSSPFNLIINSATSRLLGLNARYDISGNLLSGNDPQYFRGAGMCISSNINSSNFIFGSKIPDLNGEPYVVLSINDYHPNISLSSTMYNGFITIPLENKTPRTRFTMSNDLKEKKGVYKLGPMQTKIDQIAVTITRGDGSLYQFNGYDHQLVLRVMRKDGQNFSS